MQAEREELERERKKRAKHRDENAPPEDPTPDVIPPASLTVINSIQENMTEFKVKI